MDKPPLCHSIGRVMAIYVNITCGMEGVPLQKCGLIHFHSVSLSINCLTC